MLPAPTPTTGTLPSSFGEVDVAEAAWVSDLIELVETTSDTVELAVGAGLVRLAGFMLGFVVLGCGEFLEDSAESLEFKDAMTAAPSALASSPAMLPSSFPLDGGAGEVVSELVVMISIVLVPLSWRACNEMGVGNMMKRFERGLPLRTTSRFLYLISTTIATGAPQKNPTYGLDQPMQIGLGISKQLQTKLESSC